jgi:tetratricopeptide (TPR) repeat protein
MTRIVPALWAVLVVICGISVSSGQDVPAEARRHYEAGVTAVSKATSPEELLSAIWELEEATRLAPDWPGAFRGLGLVQKAAKKYAEAEKSLRRYLELAPNAGDADKIRKLIGEMGDQQGLDARTARILEAMAAGRYDRKEIGVQGLSGNPLCRPLGHYRLESGQLQVENGWARHPEAYHPKQRPPIPRQWEPVKIDGRFYEYTFSHYLDTDLSYTVRFDYLVKGEVLSVAPPRLKETVSWSVTWGVPIEGNTQPWTGEYDEEGGGEYLYELAPKANDVNARDAYGRTELHRAAAEGQADRAEALLAAGADVDARDNAGGRPLHMAAGFGHRNVAEALLAHRANINATNDAGDTPLYAAAYWGHKDIVGLFIEKNADLNLRNKQGKTALQVAESQKHADVATLLRSHGAK